MVTWGANTVHTIGGGGVGGFGSPAPPTAPAGGGGLFGFGSAPAPAPLFGSAPSPVGLFGGTAAPAPAPLFGSAAPSGGGGLFGSLSSAPAPSAGGLFGQPQQQQQPQYGQPQQQFQQFGQQQQPPSMMNMAIPAQAALQAHLDASARQEQARVVDKLERLYGTYTGTAAAPSDDKSADFTLVHYAAATSEILQQQWLLQESSMMMMNNSLDQNQNQQQRRHHFAAVAPPRPPQISKHEWNRAVYVSNPDVSHYMPAALVGAEALQARLSYQQEQANAAATQLDSVQDAVDLLRTRLDREILPCLESVRVNHNQQRQRLLNVMRKVELARCFNHPLQRDEVRAGQVALQNLRLADQLQKRVIKNNNNIAAATKMTTTTASSTKLVDDQQQQLQLQEHEQLLLPILKEHRQGISKLAAVVQKDLGDLHLLQQSLSSTTTITAQQRVGPPPRAATGATTTILR